MIGGQKILRIVIALLALCASQISHVVRADSRPERPLEYGSSMTPTAPLKTVNHTPKRAVELLGTGMGLRVWPMGEDHTHTNRARPGPVPANQVSA